MYSRPRSLLGLITASQTVSDEFNTQLAALTELPAGQPLQRKRATLRITLRMLHSRRSWEGQGDRSPVLNSGINPLVYQAKLRTQLFSNVQLFDSFQVSPCMSYCSHSK